MQTDTAPIGAPRAQTSEEAILLQRALVLADQFDREHSAVRREIRDMHAKLGPSVAAALDVIADNLSPFERPTRERAVAAGRAAARVAARIEARFIETHPHLEPAWIRLADVFLMNRRMAARPSAAGLLYASSVDARTRKRMRSEGWLDAAKSAGVTVLSSTGFQTATKFTQRLNWISERFLSQAAERYVQENGEIERLETEIQELAQRAKKVALSPDEREQWEQKRARINAILAETPGGFESDYKNVRYPPGDLWAAMKGGRPDLDVSRVPPRERYLNLWGAVTKSGRADFQQHATAMYQVRRQRRLDYKTALEKYFRGEAPLYLETPEQAFGGFGGWRNRLLQMAATMNTLTPEFSPQKKDAPRWKRTVGYMGAVANTFSFVNAVATSAASARAFSYREIVNRLDAESLKMAGDLVKGSVQSERLTDAYNQFEIMMSTMAQAPPQFAGPIGVLQLQMLQREMNGCRLQSPFQSDFAAGASTALQVARDVRVDGDFIEDIVLRLQSGEGRFVSMLPDAQAAWFRRDEDESREWFTQYLKQKAALQKSVGMKIVDLSAQNYLDAKSRTPEMYAENEMSNYEQMNVVMEAVLSERPDLGMRVARAGIKYAALGVAGAALAPEALEAVEVAQAAKFSAQHIWESIKGGFASVGGLVAGMVPWVKVAAFGKSAYDVLMIALSYGADPFSAVGIMIAHMCLIGMFEDIRKALATSAVFALFERSFGLAGRGISNVASWGLSFPPVGWAASIVSGIASKLGYMASGAFRRLPARFQELVPSGLDMLYVGVHALGAAWGFANYCYGLSKLFMQATAALWDIGGIVLMLATSPAALIGGAVVAGGVAYGLYRFHQRAREAYHDATNVAPSIGKVLIERPDLTLNAIRFVGFLCVSATSAFDENNPVMRAILQPYEEGSIALRALSRYVASALYGSVDIVVDPTKFDAGLLDLMQLGEDPIERQLRPLYRAAIDEYGEGAFHLMVCKTWEFVAKQRSELQDALIFENCLLRYISQNITLPDEQ
jgi:hypothetical protein